MASSANCFLVGISAFLLLVNLGIVSADQSSCPQYSKGSIIDVGLKGKLPPNCIGACNEFPSCPYQCLLEGYPSGDCTTKGHDPPCACCCNPK